MIIQKNLINNFLLANTKDSALRIFDRKDNIFPILDFINENEFINFLRDNNSKKILLKILNNNDDNNFSWLKNIKKLTKNAEDKYKEYGVWFLYLCCYFVKGKLSDKKFIKAPLILLPISIKQIEGGFIIEKKDNFIFNEKLNYLFDSETSSNFLKSFQNLEENNDNIEFNNLTNIYAANLSFLNLSFDKEKKFDKFKYDEIDSLSNFKNIEIDYSCCISLLDPTGGKIKQDILEIIEKQVNPFEKYSILKNNEEIENYTINNDSIFEIGSPLNINQKYAITSSLRENTIIYGPPGTGKSEVISTLIANILLNEKTSLVVSEKKTALDIIENRIKEINFISLSNFDNNLHEQFFNKINNFSQKLRKLDKENKQIINIDDVYLRIIDNYKNILLLENEKFLNFSKEYIFKKIFLDRNIYNGNTNILFDYFFDLLEFKKNDLKEMYDYYIKISKFAKDNFATVKFFENLTCSLETNDIKKFLNKFDSSKDKEFLLSNYLYKNKIQNKTLFSKIIKRVNYDTQKIINFLINLKDMNLYKINNKILFSFLIEEINYENFEIGIFEKYFKNLFYKETQQLLEVSFFNYLEKKYEISLKNSELLFFIYLNKFKKLYESMTIVEQEKIKEVFSIAEINKVKNVILFTKKYYEQLKIIFPIWIMNTFQCSNICPNEEKIFDYAIFDEASQIFLERSFPIVYRAEISIVSGDDKQLKPTNFFSSRNEFEEDDFDNAESLLDKSKSCMWPSFYLKNHYRSNSSNLIEFSNKYFYDSKLEFVTKNNCFNQSIEVINVKGIWDEGVNKEESIAIIEKIREVYKIYTKILIISFNEKQNDYIESLFLNNFYQNEELIGKYNDNNIVFKNLENVQGNESDLVILSIAYGFNNENKFNQFFGPLSQSGGSNRLNVAITRSKSKMIIFKSFKCEDLKLNVLNKNYEIFYNYISFLDSIKENDKLIESSPFNDNNDFRLEIKKIIESKINNNFKILTNLKLGSITIDLAITDKEQTKIYLAINIDKVYVSKNLKESINNLYKQKFLVDRGYESINIDSIEWYNKINFSLENLFSKINKINNLFKD